MKRIVLFLITIIALATCTPSKWVSIGYTNMMNEYQMVYNKEQIDSVCLSENIPDDLSKWLNIQFKDYESKRIIFKYTYIVGDSIMFVIEQDSTTYTLNKHLMQKDGVRI